MPIYMNYQSLGEVASQTQWIEINSWQWGVGRGITSPGGQSADREGSNPAVGEINPSKPKFGSLKHVRIISIPFPLPPASPPPKYSGGIPEPMPPWLVEILASLRAYMHPSGTIHLGGFRFDARALEEIAGVPIRELRNEDL